MVDNSLAAILIEGECFVRISVWFYECWRLNTVASLFQSQDARLGGDMRAVPTANAKTTITVPFKQPLPPCEILPRITLQHLSASLYSAWRA